MVRELGRARVVEVLRGHGAASRADIARATGLSRASVSAVVAALQDEGLVVEERAAFSRPGNARGRPPNLLRFNSPARAVLGIALDWQGVRAAVADLSLDVLAEHSSQLDILSASVDEMLDAAGDAADRAIRASGIHRDLLVGAGVSLPAPLDLAADQLAVLSRPAWLGLRPRRAFEQLTGVSVRVDNDANAAALAELQWGGGQGVSDFIYVKVSPGIGAAIVMGGKLYRGATGFAGELGHIRTGEDGPVCRCGNRGCLGSSVQMSHMLELLRPRHGRRLTPTQLLELVAEGDSEAVRVVHDASSMLGRALANLCNVLNPEAILIGGALKATREALFSGLRDAIDDYALEPIAEAVDVRFAELTADAEVRGALALAPIDDLQSMPGRSAPILSG